MTGERAGFLVEDLGRGGEEANPLKSGLEDSGLEGSSQA